METITEGSNDKQLSCVALAMPVDSRAAIVRLARGMPMLSADEERELAIAYHDHGDRKAGEKLCLSHLRLAVSTAKNYRNYGLPEVDLISEGKVGLLKALERFDPHKGNRFSTFASHWIKAAILDFIVCNFQIVKVATTKSLRKLFFRLPGKLRELQGRNPTKSDIARIARELEVKPEEVEVMRHRLSKPEIPLENEGPDGNPDAYSPIAYLPDSSTGIEEQLVMDDERGEDMRLLKNALAVLDERSREILLARNSDAGKAGLKQLGDKYGISAERVRQIEQKAKASVRDYFSKARA